MRELQKCIHTLLDMASSLRALRLVWKWKADVSFKVLHMQTNLHFTVSYVSAFDYIKIYMYTIDAWRGGIFECAEKEFVLEKGGEKKRRKWTTPQFILLRREIIYQLAKLIKPGGIFRSDIKHNLFTPIKS